MMGNLAHGDGNSRMSSNGFNETVTLRDDTRKRSVLGDANRHYGLLSPEVGPVGRNQGRDEAFASTCLYSATVD